MSENTFYPANALTGGATGALDAIDGANLIEGDVCITVIDGQAHIHRMDINSAAAESSPVTISPDDNAGDKRWTLQGLVIDTLEARGAVTLADNLTQANGKYIATDKVQARDSGGLYLVNDGGDGIIVTNAAKVGVNQGTPQARLHIGDDESGVMFRLQQESASATGCIFDSWHNSTSPADGDDIFQIRVFGEDDAGAMARYHTLLFEARDITNTDEAGKATLLTMVDGVESSIIMYEGYNGVVGQGNFVINDDGKDIDFRIEASGVENAFFVRGSDGKAGVGTPAPKGTAVKLHVAGAANADTNWHAECPVVVEDTDNAYINMRTPNNKLGGIIMSDPDATFSGYLLYNHTDNSLIFGVAGTEKAKLTSTGLGIDETSPDEAIHLKSSVSQKPVLKIENTNADVHPPGIKFYKSSASPADNDRIFAIESIARNSTPTEFRFAGAYSYASDITAGSEAGAYKFWPCIAGVQHELFTINGYNGVVGQGEVVVNEDQLDIDFRVEYDAGNSLISDGATGIISIPAVYSHDMNGETIRDLQINNSGELGYDSSSLRGKTEIKDIPDTAWIFDLRPVSYKARTQGPLGYCNNPMGLVQYGLIAEEVEKINPLLAFYDDLPDGDREIAGVHYDKHLLIPMLAELQRLRKEVDLLKAA